MENHALEQSEKKERPLRLISLDALRGLTIFLMLLVNNVSLGENTPKTLTHAPWNGGIFLADFVFPWFLFCVGVAIPFAYSSFIKKESSYYKYVLKVISRTIILFLLGCLLNSSIIKQPVFSLGVLQLIGLAYMVGALLYPANLYIRISISVIFLFGFWAMIKFIPIPGQGPGIFLENANLLKFINETYLQKFNLSGLLSVIPAGALVLIGIVISDLLSKKNFTEKNKLILLFALGAILSSVGFVWNLDLPFNKPVWTPSYILFTAGTASIVLGFFYYLIDMKNLKTWAYPLIVFGSNAIIAYTAPVLVKMWILNEWQIFDANGNSQTLQQWFLNSLTSKYGLITGGWFYTLGYILAWWIILWWLYRKKIFLKV